MENVFTAIFLLLLPVKKSDRKLLEIVATGCVLSEVIYMCIDDSALYYSAATALAATLAKKATPLKCVAAKTYSVLMIFQASLCATLIPSFGFEFNNLMQHELTLYNECILTVIIITCIIGTDNLITKRLV